MVRHGETAWNAVGRLQGQLDVPLSTTGMWQVGRLVDRLAATEDDERISAVVASDLARAWLTARPLAERLALELRPDPRLRERDFGRFQGHTLEEIAARWPDDFARWRERDPAWAIPAGESGQHFSERVLAALAEIARDHAGHRVLVVTHGGVLDVVYRHARALTWDAPRHHLMLNCSINRVDATATPLAVEIVDWGDVAHLSGARDELPT
ncbi:MAG: histidine phosphatase family protein [Betaproteobacteria bacterium]